MPGRPDWPGLIQGERQAAAAAAVCGVAESDGSAAEVGGDWRLLLRMMIMGGNSVGGGFYPTEEGGKENSCMHQISKSYPVSHHPMHIDIGGEEELY